MTENLKGIEIATEIALEIRAKIKATTGLNASAGISYNKFLAKMASDLNKPNGQAALTPKVGPRFVETLPVKKFHGVCFKMPTLDNRLSRVHWKIGKIPADWFWHTGRFQVRILLDKAEVARR